MRNAILSPVEFRQLREDLFHLLLLYSYEWRDKAFVLKSAAQSNMYVDCRQTTLTAEGATLVGRLFLHIIAKKQPNVQGVGGLTMGADPIVTAVTSAALLSDNNLIKNGYLVRSSEKDHGKSGLVVGPNRLKPCAEVVALDDVITSGTSTIQAICALSEERSFIVPLALAIVDREEQDALNRIKSETGIADVIALFTLSELRESRCDHSRFLPLL